MIKVNLKGLRPLLESKKWRKIKNRPGFETTEFEYKCHDWKKPRRFVAVREVIISEVEGETLFDLTKVQIMPYWCLQISGFKWQC
jgi:hypothetical protein